jgi:hypothetical protein
MMCALVPLLLLVLGVWLTISNSPALKRIITICRVLMRQLTKKQYLSGGGRQRPPQGNYREE